MPSRLQKKAIRGKNVKKFPTHVEIAFCLINKRSTSAQSPDKKSESRGQPASQESAASDR